MKREGLKPGKNKVAKHGHNDCGICAGNHKSKSKIKQEVNRQIEEEMIDIDAPV